TATATRPPTGWRRSSGWLSASARLRRHERVPVELAGDGHRRGDQREHEYRAEQERVVLRHEQAVQRAVERGQQHRERGATPGALQDRREVEPLQQDARRGRDRVRDPELDVLGEPEEQEEEGREREPDQAVLRRVDAQALQDLEEKEAPEGDPDEEEAVLA